MWDCDTLAYSVGNVNLSHEGLLGNVQYGTKYYTVMCAVGEKVEHCDV